MAAVPPSMVLNAEQEDDLIQRKLNNVELPLRKTVRQIAQILAASSALPNVDASGDTSMVAGPSDDDEAAAVEREKAAQVWSVFSAQLREVELGVKKVGVVARMEERMRAKYEAKGKQMEANKAALQQEIVTLRASLASAEQTRERKLAYDAVARDVLAVGDRPALELEIDNRRDERAQVAKQREGVKATLEGRKLAFGRLLEDLKVLRALVPAKEEEGDAEKKADENEPATAAGTPAAGTGVSSQVPTPVAEDCGEPMSKPSTPAAAEDDDDEDRARRTAPASKAPTPAASTPSADQQSVEPDAEMRNVETLLVVDSDMAGAENASSNAPDPDDEEEAADAAAPAVAGSSNIIVAEPELHDRESSPLSEPNAEKGEELEEEKEGAAVSPDGRKGKGRATLGRGSSTAAAAAPRRSTRSRSPVKTSTIAASPTNPRRGTRRASVVAPSGDEEVEPAPSAAGNSSRPKRGAAAASTSRKSSTSEPPAKKPRTSVGEQK